MAREHTYRHTIEKVFAPQTDSQWLREEQEAHETFATSRRFAYVEQPEALRILEAYVTNTESSDPAATGPGHQPLLITGTSGSGKSSLLAFWSKRYRTSNPASFIITHYVGASPGSTSIPTMLRRIIGEIKLRYDLREEIPETPERILQTFPHWLGRTRNEKLIIVIDGLNHLQESNGQPEGLDWIPDFLPQSLRFIVSSTSAEPPSRKDWQTYTLPALSTGSRREIIRQLLNSFDQESRREPIYRIAEDTRTANPLFLRTSLEELRHTEGGKSSDEVIRSLMQADDLTILYEQILQRTEQRHGLRLTRTVLSLIWASRNGLQQEELLALTNESPDTLAHLLNALDYHLIRYGNRFRFYHDHLRNAVVNRYLQSPGEQREAHRILGEWFATRPPDKRRIEEEPWQWRAAGKLPELQAFLLSVTCFAALIEWEGTHAGLDLWGSFSRDDRIAAGMLYVAEAERLTETIGASAASTGILQSLGSFLHRSALYEEAESLYRSALHLADSQSTGSSKVELLTGLGGLLIDRGDYHGAETILLRALEDLPGATQQDTGLSERMNILERLGLLHYNRGEFVAALPLFQEVMSSCTSVRGPEHPDTIEALINVGAVQLASRNSNVAAKIFRDALARSVRSLGKLHTITAKCLNNIAATLRYEQNYEEAIGLLRDVLRINQQLLGPEHPEVAANLMNLAFFEMTTDKLEDSERHYREALEINVRIHGEEHPVVATSCINLGGVLREQKAYEQAEAMYRRAARIRRRIFGPDHIHTHIAWLNVATILVDREHYEEADYIYRTSLPARADNQGREHPEVIRQYRKHASVLRKLGQVDEATAIENEMPDHDRTGVTDRS